MPNVSGRRLAELVNAIHPETAIVFMSGYTEDTVVHQGILEPGVEFLSKPFSRGVLRESSGKRLRLKAGKPDPGTAILAPQT